MPLEEYHEKRDFEHTPEPVGGAPAGLGEPLRFVVQKHHARALHYDFRLELDGVLLSWAIPKGPSFDPKDKRLAVRVEDHPIDYAGFEGTIPAGEYGAGAVIVWDRGTWEALPPKPDTPADAHAGLAKGDFKFRLSGEKLHGNWVLVRLKPRAGEKRENWLLIKERDEHARPAADYDVVAERPESVASGRTIEQLAGDGESEGEGGAESESAATPVEAPPELALCTLVSEPPAGDGWLVEAKYDGYRITAALENGHARIFERSGSDATERFPGIARAVEALPASDALLDGEAVVFDEKGVSRFGLLTDALRDAPEGIVLVAFDLLHLNGHDVRSLATTTRRDLLETLFAGAPATGPLRIATRIDGGAAEFLEAACAQGLEGIVCKRADAPYPAGRTRSWLKVKCRATQDFLVVGATRPREGRTGFGALLLAYHGGDGELIYAGRVGSGFSESEIEAVDARLRTLETQTPPVDVRRRAGGAPIERWVRPELVVEVAFSEWTASGTLRQPSFLRVRDDVEPASVVRVRAEQAPIEQPPAVEDTTRPRSATVAGVRITNPDKRLFPDSETSKLDLARYYESIAPLMLAEARQRPLTLVRCPVGDGADRGCFYQRHPDRGLPAAVRSFEHALAGHEEPDEWLWVDDDAGLVALAQLGCAEIHSWLSRVDAPGRPDRIVFDLDPGPDVAWASIVEAAGVLRERLHALDLAAFVKSTGSKGLHVVVPIEPVWEFARTHALARDIARTLASERPDLLIAEMAKAKRHGRIFVDYVRNSEAASAIVPYSTRFIPGPPVAVPLAWEELTPDLDIRAFTPEAVLKRVAGAVDPWGEIEDAAAGAKALRAAAGTLPGI